MAFKDDDLDKSTKEAIIKEFQEHGKDNGSAGVQIALLSAQIVEKQQLLRKFPNDLKNRQDILELVGARQRLLNYLKTTSMEKYANVRKKLDKYL